MAGQRATREESLEGREPWGQRGVRAESRDGKG